MSEAKCMDTGQLIDFCLSLPSAYEDYPFGEEWTILRHRTNKKIFAMVYERGGRPCINLKCEPMEADFLRGVYEAITPGYHMNKQHWNTVLLDGDVPDDELRRMMRHSFEQVKPKERKRTRKKRPL